MNDITDTRPANGAASTQRKDETAIEPPSEAEFERFADMITRDLRRAQTEEFTRAAKSHFTDAGPEGGSAAHEQAGNDLLDGLSRKHTHEQIMFRTSIGKLRSFYAKAREQQTGQDRSRPQVSAERSSDFERSL